MYIDIQLTLIAFFWFLLAVALHEWGHAYVATKFGDETPRIEGRLTLNPMAHVSFWGSIVIPLVSMLNTVGINLIGWGRPVEVSSEHFKNHRLGDILCDLAGCFCNLLFALLLVFVATFIRSQEWNYADIFYIGASVNVCLAIFNILPIPPLDGAHVVKVLFRIKDETFVWLGKWGIWIIFILVNISAFTEWIWKIRKIVLRSMLHFVRLFF